MKKEFKIGKSISGGIVEIIFLKHTLEINFKDICTNNIINQLFIRDLNENCESEINYFLTFYGSTYCADLIWEYIRMYHLFKINQICLN